MEDGGATDAHGAGQAIRWDGTARYVLKLYVTGLNRASGLAIERVRGVCESTSRVDTSSR